MGTSWHDEKVSKNFNEYNDMLEDVLGFHYIFQFIQDEPNVRSILDFGCGPGKVSERLAEFNDKYDILAVDQSQKMIDLASTFRKRKNIQYRLIENDNLGFIKSNSIDCAIICFVIINNSDSNRISNIINEVYRVLRNNGFLIILDSNPNAVGLEFTTFTNGDKGKNYKIGGSKKQYLKIPNQTDLILNDWYWTKDNYLSWITQIGFKSVSLIEPTIDNLSQEDRLFYERKYNFNKWGNERTIPPFIIFKSIK